MIIRCALTIHSQECFFVGILDSSLTTSLSSLCRIVAAATYINIVLCKSWILTPDELIIREWQLNVQYVTKISWFVAVDGATDSVSSIIRIWGCQFLSFHQRAHLILWQTTNQHQKDQSSGNTKFSPSTIWKVATRGLVISIAYWLTWWLVNKIWRMLFSSIAISLFDVG
jgi:hypothetical protein